MQTKSRRPPVSSDKRFRQAAVLSDFGTAERWQHSGRALELTERAGVLAARVTEEHIVDILVTRGLIGVAQRDAALRLKLDYQRAGLNAPVTSRYSPLTGGGSPVGGYERNDLEEAAYRRWRQALGALGMILSKPVIEVACCDTWPKAGEIAALQQGLHSLARYYRIG